MKKKKMNSNEKEHAKIEKRDKKDLKAKGNFEIKSSGKGLASTKSPVKKY